ncbi:MAG TPA: glycosyltransferase [Planctomycetota bacterium]|nr:glycosyltransferase [Planctomycetota bacterium]
MSSPLRIALLLNPFTLTRQSGDHAPELARELAEQGHVARVFGGAGPRDAAARTSAHESDSLGPRRFAPDAILAYDALSPAAWLGARTARALAIPLVLVEAGSRSDKGVFSRACLAVGERLWGPYVRRTAAALVALDPVARARALIGGFPEERVIVMPPGVDPDVYRPGLSSALVQRHGLSGRILLYVGKVERGRGLDTLVQAFARALGQRDDWSLVIAGEGGARAELRAAIDRLGIGARVRWLGRVPEEELPGLFSVSTLLAVPALDDAVRGRNVARAMACGLPVIASDRPSLRALVEPDASGLLVPSGDVVAWTEALRRAAMSPDARRRWGRRGRDIAERRLSWSHVARTFESLIQSARGTAVAAVPDEATAGALNPERV